MKLFAVRQLSYVIILGLIQASIAYSPVALSQQKPANPARQIPAPETHAPLPAEESLPFAELQRFARVYAAIKNSYVEPIEDQKLIEAAIKGMTAKPDDRKQAITALVEAAGGELIDYYVTLGEYDFLVISTAPDEQSLLKVLVTAGATGGVSDLKTTMAFSTAQFAEAAACAHKLIEGFRPAGSH